MLAQASSVKRVAIRASLEPIPLEIYASSERIFALDSVAGSHQARMFRTWIPSEPRRRKETNSNGASFGAPNGDTPISIHGMIPPSGGTYHYQADYRNAAVFCTPETFTLSNRLTIAWSL